MRDPQSTPLLPVERPGSMGYIEEQDVTILRRVARRYGGVKVIWRNGRVSVHGRSGQRVYCTFNRHIYETIAALQTGDFQ